MIQPVSHRWRTLHMQLHIAEGATDSMPWHLKPGRSHHFAFGTSACCFALPFFIDWSNVDAANPRRRLVPSKIFCFWSGRLLASMMHSTVNTASAWLLRFSLVWMPSFFNKFYHCSFGWIIVLHPASEMVYLFVQSWTSSKTNCSTNRVKLDCKIFALVSDKEYICQETLKPKWRVTEILWGQSVDTCQSYIIYKWQFSVFSGSLKIGTDKTLLPLSFDIKRRNTSQGWKCCLVK